MSDKPQEYDFTLPVAIEKRSMDDEKMLVGGIAYLAKQDGETLTDTQGHQIEPDDLREAFHDFIRGDRKLGVMHIKKNGEPVAGGEVVEMAVLGDGFAPEGWPEGTVMAWMVAKIKDPEVWAGVKDGTFTGFSVAGSATLEPVE